MNKSHNGAKKETLKNRRIKEKMAEGYKEMAEENRRLAEMALPLQVEALSNIEPWS